MNSLLPADLPRFFLRADFAIENGVLDAARQPASFAEYLKHIRGAQDAFSWAAWREHCAERAAFRLPRYLGYVGMIAPRGIALEPQAFDGRRFFPLPPEGLWTDLEERARAALGMRRDAPVPFNAVTANPPVDQWTIPTHGVLHDTVEALACVTDYPRLCQFLLFTGGQKSKA